MSGLQVQRETPSQKEHVPACDLGGTCDFGISDWEQLSAPSAGDNILAATLNVLFVSPAPSTLKGSLYRFKRFSLSRVGSMR